MLEHYRVTNGYLIKINYHYVQTAANSFRADTVEHENGERRRKKREGRERWKGIEGAKNVKKKKKKNIGKARLDLKFRRIGRFKIPLTNVFVYTSHQDIMIDCNFLHSYATKPVRPVD